MRCEDIDNNLNSDAGDLDGILKHLEICPVCAEKYAADLELETALRQISLAAETVDITDSLKANLYQRYKQQSLLRNIRKWVWVAASLAAVMIIVIGLPLIVEWLKYGYFSFINILPALEAANDINLNQLADEVESSKYYGYIIISVLGFFIGISACLWREIKELIA